MEADEVKQNLALYMHIPFCKSKCNYCDFNSYPGREDEIPQYFEAIKREIAANENTFSDYNFKTIFIGGGTPSLVEPQYIFDVLNYCNQKFKINSNAEISIETNPGTLSYNKLMTYKSLGINRISIGLQAWQNKLLKNLGRIHTSEEFVENYKLAKKAGFKNINIDLIFGLPGQTLKDWQQTLKYVIELEPAHVSCYSLKIEDDTVYGKQLRAGQLIYPDEELDREMYYTVIDELGKNGLEHYEISNFARPGFECRHNLVYWKAENYIGMGAGAHSFFGGKRFNNILPIDGYINAITNKDSIIENTEIIGFDEQMSEYMILGLRLIEGVSKSQFKQRFRKDIFELYKTAIEKLMKKELLRIEGERLKLTSSGLDYANQVFVEFI